MISCLKVIAQGRTNNIVVISDDHAIQAIGARGSKLMHTPSSINFYSRVFGALITTALSLNLNFLMKSCRVVLWAAIHVAINLLFL
jgi:hypothetical protein